MSRQKSIKPDIDMLYYEKKHPMEIIAGIDEAGRGPLYGEVVAAAVILPSDFNIDGINDSKQLSAKRRQELFKRIIKLAPYGVGSATSEEIDKINILNATKLAAKRAVENLISNFPNFKPDHLLTDALDLPDINIEYTKITKGDSLSASIAAASIVAKVIRDHILIEEGKKYPQYKFENHKGYGTVAHYKAIEEFGILPKHRRSFLKKLNLENIIINK